MDILDWNPLEYYKPGELDFVWISIPCVEYSRALTTRPRDLEKADRIAIAALKVLFTLLPKTFAIENPKGLLRDRPFMAPLRRFLKSCSYCMFIDWDANEVLEVGVHASLRHTVLSEDGELDDAGSSSDEEFDNVQVNPKGGVAGG